MNAHERYDVSDASVLFEDTWAEEARAETCDRCGASLPVGGLRCSACGAHVPVCVGVCSACAAPRCVGGKRRL